MGTESRHRMLKSTSAPDCDQNLGHVRPVDMLVQVKDSGIWNDGWQANVCERGREWGMALEVANVWRGRV